MPQQLPSLFKTQISMHEWFEQIGHEKAQAVRDEDLTRQARLKQLNEITGLPYDKPEIFSLHDLLDKTKKFTNFFEQNKNKKCRLRLLPLTDDAQKLRTVGRTISEAVEWFKEQNIDPDKYKLHFFKFSDETYWSTIFIVNNNGIFGEIIWGGHSQLTQGFHENKPITFSFDFNSWKLSRNNSNALEHLKSIVKHLFISDKSLQQKLERKLGVTFAKNYLKGYFETVLADNVPLQFLDYNRVLGEIYKDFTINPIHTDQTKLTGQTGSPGIVTGKVRIVKPEQISHTNLNPDEILVCDMTSPDYVPLMRQAAGIITDCGGILSHAAIVSRELGKPCIVGVGNAVKMLEDGQKVKMDADKGIINQ